jgi:hypothetical protein
MYLSCKYIGIRKWVKLVRGPKRISVSILLTGQGFAILWLIRFYDTLSI